MPDDNSCMFTAFGGVLQRADPAPTLRREVAEYILSHPEKFDQVVLEMDPQRYARLIQTPDRWGGAIELSILSDIYDIEICSVDVKVCHISLSLLPTSHPVFLDLAQLTDPHRPNA